MWTLFEIILAGFCDERWHYLTVSWHYPLGHLWISLCLTLSQKHVEFRMDTKIQTNFTNYFWFSLATASYFQFGSLYVVLYLYFVFVEGLVCVWFARGQVTGVLSRGRVAGAGVDKWPYFVGERSPPSSGRPWSHTALLALQGTARMHTHTWWHIPRAHNVLMCYQHLVVLLGCTLHTWPSTHKLHDCMFDTMFHTQDTNVNFHMSNSTTDLQTFTEIWRFSTWKV